MFPISDDAPRSSFPFVNLLIIVLNFIIFFAELSVPDFDKVIGQYAFIPSQFHFSNPLTYIPIFTSLFLHGGFFHIISNMWFLFIFGDNIEDRLGHFKYVVFYLIGGFVSVISQYIFDPSGAIPLIGASGAISAIAGAYFVFFRNSRIKSLVALIFIWTITEVPVWFFLGYWFFIQLFSGIGSLVTFDIQHGGVAFFAHVGGFIYGYLIAKNMNKHSYLPSDVIIES